MGYEVSFLILGFDPYSCFLSSLSALVRLYNEGEGLPRESCQLPHAIDKQEAADKCLQDWVEAILRTRRVVAEDSLRRVGEPEHCHILEKRRMGKVWVIPPGNWETICKMEFNKQCQQDHNDHIYGRMWRPERGFSLSCVRM